MFDISKIVSLLIAVACISYLLWLHRDWFGLQLRFDRLRPSAIRNRYYARKQTKQLLKRLNKNLEKSNVQ